jgi:CheY-like chemotaxis protein
MSEAASVLHVDDDPDCLAVSRHAFERRSDVAEVVTADSAAAGLARLEAGSFDCVVSDSVRLPDGETFVSAARRREPSAAIVLFTGVEDPAGSPDADAVVVKGDDGGVQQVAEAAVAAVRSTDAGEEWAMIGSHDWEAGTEFTVTLTQSVAREVGCDPLELPALYDAVDPEALEAFLTPAGEVADVTDGGHAEASVTFTYGDLEVRVTGTGQLAAR